MKKRSNLLLLLIILTTIKTNATTWDEPWAEEVIRNSGSFVLGKVISSDPGQGLKVLILKNLGGNVLSGTIIINDFYSLKICSSSGGHGAEFSTEQTDSCYFFIKRNSKEGYSIATPTTGFDYVTEGKVSATFRHSYHQASVPVSVYEKAMVAIFNNYHDLPYDKKSIESFIRETISKAPAGFDDEEINLFYLQHVALECVYHLKLVIPETMIIPFLNDEENFHNQVSGARALQACNSDLSRQELVKTISDTTKSHFVKVICTWSLAKLHPTAFKVQLQEIEKSSSDESDGFGGNIMDPRVCTNIPGLKSAIRKLLENL